jgi:CRP-like cAMP-binding protein
MISPEVLRRYPFFAGLSHDQLTTLAMIADEMGFESGHSFFKEEDKLDAFYLVTEGTVAIVIEVTAGDVAQPLSQQLTGQVQTSDVVISYVGPGEPFGWTAITPEQISTAGARAMTTGKTIAFDRRELLQVFEEDPGFGYLMLQQILQVARQRIHDLRVESLAQPLG